MTTISSVALYHLYNDSIQNLQLFRSVLCKCVGAYAINYEVFRFQAKAFLKYVVLVFEFAGFFIVQPFKIAVLEQPK